jgi:MoaA/NifB/PqqE/SkfB family radical SAM enzyme
MEEKFKKISEMLGSKVTIEENPKSAKKKDEEFFMGLLEQLCQIEAAAAMLNAIGLTSSNENPFYISIRMLMMQHYGEIKTEIILWWVFESISPDGDVYPLVDEDGKKHIIKTPTQLYKFIKKYD